MVADISSDNTNYKRFLQNMSLKIIQIKNPFYLKANK